MTDYFLFYFCLTTETRAQSQMTVGWEKNSCGPIAVFEALRYLIEQGKPVKIKDTAVGDLFKKYCEACANKEWQQCREIIRQVKELAVLFAPPKSYLSEQEGPIAEECTDAAEIACVVMSEAFDISFKVVYECRRGPECTCMQVPGVFDGQVVYSVDSNGILDIRMFRWLIDARSGWHTAVEDLQNGIRYEQWVDSSSFVEKDDSVLLCANDGVALRMVCDVMPPVVVVRMDCLHDFGVERPDLCFESTLVLGGQRYNVVSAVLNDIERHHYSTLVVWPKERTHDVQTACIVDGHASVYKPVPLLFCEGDSEVIAKQAYLLFLRKEEDCDPKWRPTLHYKTCF